MKFGRYITQIGNYSGLSSTSHNKLIIEPFGIFQLFKFGNLISHFQDLGRGEIDWVLIHE